MNEILLRRKHKLMIEPMDTRFAENGDVEIYRYVLAIAKNIEALGFSFDESIINVLKTYTRPKLIHFNAELIPMLKKLCAADVEYKPMYPNFPDQLASTSDAELFMNAILHYWSNGSWLPEYAENARMPLVDADKTVILSLGDVDDLYDIFHNLASSKTSLSSQDKDDLVFIMKNYPGYETYLPDEIPLKENVALIAKTIITVNPYDDGTVVSRYFHTATDVLRFIVSLSDGDISLAERTQFKHMHRPERRMIMNLLSHCGDILEDMYRYRDEWIRIGEIVHPWEYKDSKYDDVRKAFNILRNEEKPLFRMGRVEEAIKNGDMLAAARELVARPGEFARRLDKLLRDSSYDERGLIVKHFDAVADKVATPVLMQVRQAFIARSKDEQPKVRVFMPKGSIAKAVSVPYDLRNIDHMTCNAVINVCNHALMKSYKQREPMGCVYIDPELSNYIVPFSQRSASAGNKIIVRGSRVPIRENAKTIRAFVWWTNLDNLKSDWYGDNNRVDIDLSACILDENFAYKSYVSYTRLKDDKLGAYHSGDIVNGGNANGKGVAEFLDVDIDSVVQNGGRYICYQVYSFTRQKFSQMPNCRFGWMEREFPDSGEIFEPKTVEMAIDLNTQSNITVPVLFDCVERELIWMDMAIEARYFSGGNNIESNLSGVRAVAYSIVNINKPNIYDLIYLNALARGCIVYDREVADIIFSNDATKPTVPIKGENQDVIAYEQKDVPIVTAFDADYYMGKLL